MQFAKLCGPYDSFLDSIFSSDDLIPISPKDAILNKHELEGFSITARNMAESRSSSVINQIRMCVFTNTFIQTYTR